MQAVILAAGLGRRLGALTEQSTKCMVQVNGRRLIEFTLDSVVECGLSRIVMVVGHGAEEVRALIGSCYRGVPVRYVENAAYRTTNNIYSLLLAREYLSAEDSVVIESDVVFNAQILRDCLADPAPNLAVVSAYRSWMDGTVVLLDDRRHIVRFVPRQEFEWKDTDRYFKTVNVYKLSRAFLAERFVPFLDTYVQTEGRNAYYEEVLRLLAFMGTGQLTALPVDNELWYEVDDVNDLDIASTLFAPAVERRARFEQRFGGYWRFPHLRDFYYLVNPFFPSRELVAELTHALPDLISQYPSGSRVQRLLAGRLLNCDSSLVAVGNGASELIQPFLQETDTNARGGPDRGSTVGVVLPTFEEYRRPIPGHKVVEFTPPGPDFAYSARDLLSFCERAAVGTLVLVNPANPTGYYLDTATLLEMTSALAELGTRVVVDESFVDFVDGTPGPSLIQDRVLAKAPGLVVIKSISKSYGVPGLRLGVLASADRDLIQAIAGRLPIWNINSIAEYLLQIIGKYQGTYWTACADLARERAWFEAALAAVPCLRPLQSWANYVLCEVRREWSSAALADALLQEHWILVKDCSGKHGLGARQYLRIAVKNRDDNEYFLKALGQVAVALAPRTASAAAD